MKSIRQKVFELAILFLLSSLFSLPPISVYSQDDLIVSQSADDELEEELRYLKAETYVITASRIPETIKKAPSSISVITDKQIRQMGARHLVDVIQTIPGMSVWYPSEGEFEIAIRGFAKRSSNIVLLMVNGHTLNDPWSGGATWIHDTMMLDNVKRIEVLRGPGSALYGANAIAVINVITKDAEDIDGWELTTRGGSYDTQQYNLLYGKTFNDLEVALNYNYFNTHGFNGHVNDDRLSTSPFFLRGRASLTPGRMRGDDEKHDASLNLKYKGFTFDGKYVDREKDIPVGVYGLLSKKSTRSPESYYLNLSYERTLGEDLELFGKVYRNRNNYNLNFHNPPGDVLLTPLGPAIVADGVKSIFSIKTKRTGFETYATYRMGDTNTVLVGITYEEMKQYDRRSRSNVLQLPFGVGIPLPSVRDLSDIRGLKSLKRNFKAFYIEDIWDITDDLRFTIGVRYDDYSDFGSEVSPRAGVVWEFKKGYDIKLLYGHAFRVPSLEEISNTPDLDPETLDIFEVSLGAEFTPSLTSRLTFYHAQGEDNIVPGPTIIVLNNSGKSRFQGVEVEAKYDFRRGSYFAMNYAYRRIMSPHTKTRYDWLTPRHLGNIMVNIRLNKYLNLYTSCHIEDGFRRDRGDNRDNMSGYAIVNATLIAKKFLEGYEGLELRGSVYNLFDKDYTSPYYPVLPDDMPRPGRNFLIEVKYKF